MRVVSGTLYLYSGKEVNLPSADAVETVSTFWSSIPRDDDIPTVLDLSSTQKIILTRSSIVAIEQRVKPD
ncbi:MAG: hypothetical protein ABI681_14560 [Gemmatimonadales bacterium]